MHPSFTSLSPAMLSKIGFFLEYASRYKNDILLAQPAGFSPSTAPNILPQSISQLLCTICDLSSTDISALWHHLRDQVWHHRMEVESITKKLRSERTNVAYGKLNYSGFDFLTDELHSRCIVSTQSIMHQSRLQQSCHSGIAQAPGENRTKKSRSLYIRSRSSGFVEHTLILSP